MDGVSIIVPAYNAERTIVDCLRAATNLNWPGNLEVIVINDGSTDRTEELASSIAGVRVVTTANGGAAHATNTAIRAARYAIVVSLDADAVLEPDWIQKILPSFDEPGVGAVAGYAVTANKSIVGKLMGYDVELRLDRSPKYTDHLYTMNTAYLREALLQVGMLDESMKIAYDADLSRRLRAAGYKLVLIKDATCRHYWRDDLKGYIKQQYNYAYYRLLLTQKFGKPHDRLVSLGMVSQVPFTVLVVIIAALLTGLLSPFGLLALFLIPLVHLPETVALLVKKKDRSVLLLPWFFSLRNLTWTWAAAVWGVRRLVGRSRA